MTIIQELKVFLDHTLAEMEDLKQHGCITDRLYKHYCFLWLWSAPRWDHRHNRLFERMGRDAYWRRIDRVKALENRIRAVDLPAPQHIPFRVGALNP